MPRGQFRTGDLAVCPFQPTGVPLHPDITCMTRGIGVRSAATSCRKAPIPSQMTFIIRPISSIMSKRIRILIPFLLLLLALLWLPGPWAHAQEGGDTPVTYTVQPGDTLSLIAQRFNVPLDVLIQVNHLDDPNLIQVGQVLTIPDQQTIAQAQAQAWIANQLPELQPILTNFALGWNAALHQAMGFTDVQALLPFYTSLGARDPQLALPITRITTPDHIIQGQTGVVRVTQIVPFPPQGTYQGRSLNFVREGKDLLGYHFFAFMPTGALDKPGDKPLTIHLGQLSWERVVPVLAGSYETQHIVLPPSKGGLLDPTKLKEERERLYALWARVSGPPRWHDPFRFPIGEGFERTSPYGTRRSYNGGPVSSFHAGSDWGAPEGTPILAPAPGVVVLAEPLFVRGGAVIIDHGAGVYSNFWHMSRIDVKPGDEVQTGDQLGLVGTTGLSTGAHLHWEIRVNTVAVDPMQWTQQRFP